MNSLGLACFDVNGDGFDDLLWTTRDSLDVVYLHYRGTSFSGTPILKLRNLGVANFGNAIEKACDMNGDGYNDIAVAANDHPYHINKLAAFAMTVVLEGPIFPAASNA